MEGEMNRAAESESPRSGDGMNNRSAAFDQTMRTMGQAYTRSTRAIGETYNHALAFGKQNPGKTTLIAFGVGVGIGMLLLGGSRRHSRVRRYGEPIVNALSDMAVEFVRKL